MRIHPVAGFTMIEMLLSISIIGGLTVLSIPLFQSFQNRNELDIAGVTMAQSLRRAQLLSQGSDGDIGWGVQVSTGLITLFKGASYATRDPSYDELFTMSSAMNISGTQEYTFAKFSGEPQTTGSLMLTSPNNETRTITINAKGMVAY